MKYPIVIEQEADDMFNWVLLGKNGKKIAMSFYPFKSRRSARRGAKRIFDDIKRSIIENMENVDMRTKIDMILKKYEGKE